MNEATKQRAIKCQQWAEHYAHEAAIARKYASDEEQCRYRARALRCQQLAQVSAATARAILTD